MSYGDTHRFLLRLIASQSVMSLEHTKKLVEKKAGSAVNLEVMIKEINRKIGPLKQEIRVVKDEVIAEDVVVFISTATDDTMKAQNVFSVVESEFFRILIVQIIESREISEISALNLVNNIKVGNRNSTLKKTDAQRILAVWCRMHYLQKQNNYYVLGVRAVNEFESYLLENWPDVMKKCFNCSKIVCRGYNCPYCKEAVHSWCLEDCLSTTQRWPCCKRKLVQSQLQQLRSQRLTQNTTLDATQSLEPTQILEATQPMHDNTIDVALEDTSHEMDVDDSVVNESRRGQKRKRIILDDDDDS